mgnify:CR=1 FL=1
MMWFDLALGLGLIIAAIGVFRSEDLFRAVVLFVTFGILLALTWLRLQAPDLALAEAAIGAGITGVLLLDTLGVFRQHEQDINPRSSSQLPDISRQWAANVLALIACISAAGLLAWSLFNTLKMPAPHHNLVTVVEANIADSGVSHGITAVLLNFRSYDTLLEVAVLLVAIVIGIGLRERVTTSANATSDEGQSKLSEPPALLTSLVRLLLPLLLITAIFVLWAGSTRPGGAFQAGALIAAAGVLARLGQIDIAARVTTMLRLGLTLGVFIFLIVAVSPMLTGKPFLTYPAGWEGTLILLIEFMLTISIGLILLSLFIQAPRPRIPAPVRNAIPATGPNAIPATGPNAIPATGRNAIPATGPNAETNKGGDQ